MMLRFVVLFVAMLSAVAFAPAGRTSSSSKLSMDIKQFIGAPTKVGGFFDPFKLSEGKDIETLKWYRSSELKHGRIAMLATVGVIIQELDTKIIPGFPVTAKNPFEAVQQVYYKNPGAAIQIGLAIAAVEVLSASIESKEIPGDYGWDPANIRPTKPELLEDFQKKELNNGRLALVGIAGIAAQVGLNGHLF